MADNKTLMQYFEWYLPNDGLWWKRCAAKASNIAKLGVTHVWLPPAYKAIRQDDVGYAVYDMFDLGEFDQKGTVRTKYGTKDEYIEAIRAMHDSGLSVLADIVLNHRMEGDETEDVKAVQVASDNRNYLIGDEVTIRTKSKFTYPGRNGKYSDFVWDHNHFTGTDINLLSEEQGKIYLFSGKEWNPDTDKEFGNFDYLMGLNVDLNNPEVMAEITKWFEWYVAETGIDGLRLDAVKHMSSDFYRKALKGIHDSIGYNIPTVGEYWSSDVNTLISYLEAVDNRLSLFDVALHFKFFEASESGRDYDLRNMFSGTLVSERPEHAITFVDNHDTQYGQSLQSYVQDWFKQMAYAVILLRQEGLPCVFYTDYYGNPAYHRPLVPNLGRLVKIRKYNAYGKQIDYFEDGNIIGWVRQGDEEHKYSGIAVVMSNGEAGSRRMCMGPKFAGQIFRDSLGIITDEVVLDKEGWGEFPVEGGSVSVWTTQEAFESAVVYD
jgi:alpha-amylase